MANYQILLADNTPAFLETYGTFLESNGYDVWRAHTPDEATALLENGRIHFAILDLRLLNDSDELDKSGLQIAKDVARSVPKMILTNYPVYQDVVEVMRRDVHHLQPAVEFLDKKQTSLEELADTVSKTLRQYVQINWDLVIHWESAESFLHFANLLSPQLAQDQLGMRTAEFEDLFRMLFCDFAQITIGKRLALTNGRIVLPIFAFNAQGVQTKFIVSCGCQSEISVENERYEKVVPARFGIKNIGRLKTAETTHYAATAYTFMGSDLESTTVLADYIGSHATEQVTAVLDHLYRQNLGGWYATGREEKKSEDLADFYAKWSGLEEVSPAQLYKSVAALAEKALAMNLMRIDLHASQMQFRFGDEEISLLNPIRIWENSLLQTPTPVVWGITHGRLNGETVLVDLEQQGWLIDFAQVDRAPLLIDFVSLETAVKYHIFDCKNIAKRIQLEQLFSSSQTIHLSPDVQALSPPKVHIAQIVTHIRELAVEQTDCTLYDYHYALFYAVLAHLATYDSTTFYTPRVLSGYIHALYETAVLAEKLSRNQTETIPAEAEARLWLDMENEVVWVEGYRHDLTSQEYKILLYLYQRAGKLCEKQDIVEEALDELYDPYDLEQSRLTTAVSRLRRKLEPNPRKPKYLITVHGRGYRLDLN